jgi:hypothetical protein
MKYFLLLFLSFISLFSIAQNAPEMVVPDVRLYEVYERDYVKGLVNENPFLIKRWNYYLDNSFIITDAVAEKEKDYPSVTILDLRNINILLIEKEQHLQRNWDVPTIYKIRGTDKILVYHAGKDFAEALKKHLGEK